MELIKRYGNIIIIICIILEMLIWPSINNFFGCLMTVISWIIFSRIGLKEQVIREHIFAWLVFLSMSLYRILPLIATLLEGRSIGYNFLVPLSTYCGETLLYLISALAFYLAIIRKKTLPSLKFILQKCGFYDPINNKTLWILGIIGLIFKIYTTINYIEYGNILGKTLAGFTFLQYAPILIFFPNLMGNKQDNKVLVFNITCVIYIVLLVVFSFATNQRMAMLEPIGTFALLLLLSFINSSKTTRKTINRKFIIQGFVIAIFIIPIVNDISLAMLYNRRFRTNTNRKELLFKTIETLSDKDRMEQLRSLKEKMEKKAVANEMSKTWSETYVSNFALNRYCNLKITDNTLYHARKVGFPNEQMTAAFWLDVAAIFPTPLLRFFGIDYDKNDGYSRGDRLKALSANRHPFFSLLVTSHLADGLLVFGYWYFLIEFILFYIRFLFLDTFILNNNGKIRYSIFGLVTIFSFLAMFQHAGGGCDSLGYLLRWYWQDIILFLLGITLIKKILSLVAS